MARIRMVKALGTVLLKIAAFWILLVAAYLALGRQFFPLIERYNAELALMLSDRLNTSVSIGGLTGEWRQFNPILIAEDVQISSTLSVDRMLLEPALIQSLVTLSPVFKRFELTGFEANLAQTEQGWTFAGVGGSGRAGAPDMSLARVIALIRQQREVRFTDMALHIEPLLLPGMTVAMESAQLTGLGDDNWMRAQASVNYDGLSVPIELQLESSRQNNQYEVDLYARHGAFDMAPWLQKQFPDVRQVSLAGEYWISLTRDQWQSVQARLQSPVTRFSGSRSDMAVRDLDMELFAERSAEGVDLWLHHFTHELERSPAITPEIQNEFVVRASQRQSRWQVQWDQLPMAPISAFLAVNDNSGYWRQAFPEGRIDQGKLSYRLGQANSLRLTAAVNNVRMQPYSGIPGVSGISGTVRAEGNTAQVSFDNRGVNFELPAIYDQPFVFERIDGVLDVRWSAGAGVQLEGQHRATIAPDATQLSLGVPSQPLTGHWRVDLVNSSDIAADQREIGLRLAVATESTGASWAKRLTPDSRLPDAVKPWIVDNLQSGRFSDLDFSFASGFRGGRMTDSGLALVTDFSQAEVSFNDDWPAITGGSGQVRVSLDDLYVDAQSGDLAGVGLRRGQLHLPFSERELLIDLDVAADADQALALFKQDGPLDYLAADVVSDWTLAGATEASLNLRVPLSGESIDVALISQVSNGKLDLAELDLSLSELSGSIGYNRERGLYSDRLDGQLFGTGLQARLTSDLIGDNSRVSLSVSGETPLDAWGRWLGDPWLASQPYQVAADARLDFLPGETRISVQSDLVNLPLAFPAIVGKTAETSRPLALNLVFSENQGLAISGHYNEVLQWAFDVSPDSRLEAGTLALNTPLERRSQPGIYVDALLPDADIDQWRAALQSVADLYRDADSPLAEIGSETGLQQVREVNLRGALWRGQGLNWTQPRVQILSSDEGWLATLEARELSGRVLIPFNGDPHFADFDFVNIDRTPQSDSASSSGGADATAEPDPMAMFRPDDLPDANLQIARLSIDGRDMGSWRAEIRRVGDSAVLQNLRVEMPEARLEGELTWRYLDNEHRTAFKGQIRTGNILSVLQSWDYAPVLESRTGQFDLDFEWPGTPAYFDYKRLRGRIELRLTNGAILELDEYEGVKLVGLLNFTRVLRRLALDFSDLIRDGISYDVIEGELLFDRGFARVGDRLLIDGPSTKFRFSGDADLVRDVLDVDMVMTVPLSSTFPLVALLAGVTPQAAAAIYVTERVFNNELERLSSARMHVTGSLEEPELRFYRVFDINSGSALSPSVGDRLRNVVPTNPGSPGSP
ncbi:YhdP family protein [Saccharospirillum impatiens]|uniref:YhdP family phospholipid transporter n=1 Tax=Saccharospirillum impatiens TaxID=169438 RepID=UPI00040E20F9|nr:AsmA-like C-terminal region-containing protein [Saccharospirillum impatiens]